MSLSKNVQGLGGADIPAALGHRTVRLGTGDLAEVAEVNLFTVIGGDILLTSLYGEITTVMDAGTTTIQLQFNTAYNPAATINLCGAHASIANYLKGTIFTITGAHGDAMVDDNTKEGVAKGSFATNLDILVPGIIFLDVGSQGNTGVIQWVIHWVPLSKLSNVIVTPPA